MYVSQTHEIDDLGHLDLSEDTTRDVVTEARGVADREGIRSLDRYFSRLTSIELLHALHLSEGDEISVF